MYVNKIDELIDKIIDNFYNDNIKKNSLFDKLKSEINFVKNQSVINKIISNFAKKININEIKTIIDKEENINRIINVIKRYIAYYIFLIIGYYYPDKKDHIYINNIVEYSKLQADTTFKIDNFFNSENNSIIIKYFKLIKDIIYVINLEDKKNLNITKYKTAILFLNNIGAVDIKNLLIGNTVDKAHNLIKIIIFSELYNKQERKYIFKLLYDIEKEAGEYIDIDIVVSTKATIDYSSIENILSLNQLKSGYASKVYELLDDYLNGKYSEKMLSINKKIDYLIHNKIIVPIVDDFLRFHKDSEKSEFDKNSKSKDTKIKYIVDKTDSVSELYSDNVKKNPELKKEIEKKLYVPLSYRKVTLINDTEEIRVINKIHNIGFQFIKENEYYFDLVNYKLYPYINFKDFKNDGFNFTVYDKIIDLIRYSTFEFKKANEKISKNSLQLRIGSNDMNINIVGFMFNIFNKPLECLQLSNFTDIRKYKFKNKIYDNGYQATYTLLKNNFLKNKKINKSLYWIFNQEKDKIKMDTYEEINNINKSDTLKLIISKLYDDLILHMGINLKNKFLNIKETYPYYAMKYLKKYQTKFFKLDKNSNLYNEILSIITNQKFINVDTGYDYNEDKIPGSTGKLIKIPVISGKKQKDDIIYIKLLKEKNISKTEIMYMTNDAVCQHNLKWYQINLKKRNNPSEFNEELFKFIEKYVMENNEQDYVCKSCGLLLPIKKYMQDGIYDTSQGKFITFYLPIETQLEEIKEYEKFNKSIRNIDKLIEKICSIADITAYVGSASSNRLARQGLIKSVIDLIILHNKTLKTTNLKQRSSKLEQMYGINTKLSNLFSFELDDTIFTYSSKDTDKYKILKFNNILVYIIVVLILELNDNQIVNLKNDKFCNFFLYQKVGSKLFDNLKIVQNIGQDIREINDYNVLTFTIYYFSCLLARFKIWNYSYGGNLKTSFPLVQMMAIHTLIDIFNSILEVDIDQIKNKNFIYKIFITKFFIKLDTDFKDNTIIDRVKIQKQNQDRKLELTTRKNNITEIPGKQILGNMVDYDDKYMHLSFIKVCNNSLFIVPTRKNTRPVYNNLSSITNCEDGEFHKWKMIGKRLQCGNCSVFYDEIKKDKNNETIKNNYKKKVLNKLANKYCKLGYYHEFNINNICTKCGVNECGQISLPDLLKLEKNVKQIKKNQIDKNIIITNQLKESLKNKSIAYKSIIDNIKQKYSSNKNFNYIDKLLDNIHSVIGKNININNSNLYTKNNVYIINHNRYGNILKDNIIINEYDNLIQTKLNHDFFKTDVIYYTNKKEGNVQTFYNKLTRLYLGYREPNREYVLSDNKNIHIQINYSIYNRLIQLGYNYKLINISDKINELSKHYDINTDEEQIIENIIGNISRNRIHRLKKMIVDFNRSLYQIKYNFDINNSVDKINNITKTYMQKLKNIKINGDIQVLQNWKAIVSSINYKKADVININTKTKYVDVNDILKYDNSGNLILFYMVQEMNNLIDTNSEKFVKVNIVYLIIDLINYYYNLYNIESKSINKELRKFKYILKSELYVIDMEKKGYDLEGSVEGIYDEYMDKDELTNEIKLEKIDEDVERLGALDIDTGMEDDVYGSDYDYQDEQLHRPDYV